MLPAQSLFYVIVHGSRMNHISNKQQDLDHGMANGDEKPSEFFLKFTNAITLILEVSFLNHLNL